MGGTVLVHRLARLLDASFRPRLATVALASSLGLHLHLVGQRTFTSELLSNAQHTTKPLARQTLRVILLGRAIAMSKVSWSTTTSPQHGTRFRFNTRHAIALPNQRASFKRLYRKGAGRASPATPGAFPAARFRYSTNVFRSQSSLNGGNRRCSPKDRQTLADITGCMSSKSGCFAKSATCRNLTSGRLSHVNWAHDPASPGFSFLVRCLLPLAT